MIHKLSRSQYFSRCKLVGLLTALGLFGLLLSAQGCTSESDDTGTTATENTTAATTATDALTEEWLIARSAAKIGSSTLVRDVTITENGADRQIKIEVDRPEVCHDGAVVSTLTVFAQNMMGILYKKYPEVSDVEIVMYGPEQGVVSDEVAMSMTMTRESARDIDWFAFDETNVFQLVDSYYMHPRIEESYRLEGALPYDQQPQ